MKIKFTVELDFESWFNKNREPKTKGEWEVFLNNFYVPESGILGIEDEDYADIIAINRWNLEVNDINTE